MGKKLLKIFILVVILLLILIGTFLYTNRKNVIGFSLKKVDYSSFVKIKPLIGDVNSFYKDKNTISIFDTQTNQNKVLYISENTIFYKKSFFDKSRYVPSNQKIWDKIHIGDKVFANTYRPTVIYILDK